MIKVLDNSVINKIAAGEVIERQANVVKELLENSLDSGSDEIRIDLIDNGLKKIRVSDNGTGMSAEDVMVCFKRHATSKIKSDQDLTKIESLGFRGEALSSIAGVSNMKIVSKTMDSSVGVLLELEAGKIVKKESIGCSTGTSIEVNDLFYNVPARKKFLKSGDVEFSHILNIITRYALINKEVTIKLFHNDKEVINSQKTDSLLNNIFFIYGDEVTKNLVRVNNEQDGIKVNGYISKPSLTRGDKQDQSLYVNNRYVKDNVITSGVYDGYKTLLFINRHPIFVLNVSMDYSEVDVNVHPAKTLVRLKNEDRVYQAVKSSIKKALESSDLIREVDLDTETSQKASNDYAFTKSKQTVLMTKEEDLTEETEAQNHRFSDFLILGQINKTYVIAENEKGLLVIDQHAAEERVNYEKFMIELRAKAIKKQGLFQARVIELDPVKYKIAVDSKQFLEKIGFGFEVFGENSIKLTSIPEIFGRLKSTLFIDILNELYSNKDKIINQDIEERIIRFACRASVKAGEELTLDQMKSLIKELAKAKNPYSCPHGRPTMINLSIADLEKKFKRSGW